MWAINDKGPWALGPQVRQADVQYPDSTSCTQADKATQVRMVTVVERMDSYQGPHVG